MSDASEKPQTYANHRRFPPIVYALAGLLLLVEFGRRTWVTLRQPSLATAWAALVMLALIVVWYESRRRAQVVQDRLIRLEMRVRLERVLGAARRADIERLTLGQLIGLRFASDAELPALVDEVLAGRLADQDAIKKRVKDWQADWLRV